VGAGGAVTAADGGGCPITPTGLPLTLVAVGGGVVFEAVGAGGAPLTRSGPFFPFSWVRTVCTFCANGEEGISLGLGVETFDGR
jgi:hypothetical protein